MKARTLVRGTVLAILFVGLALLIAAAAVSAWGRKQWKQSAARFERESGSLDLRSWELRDVPIERNAATWISHGAAALVLDKQERDGYPVWLAPANWSAADVAAIRARVALNRDGLAVLAHARGLTDSTFGIRLRDGSGAKLPNLLQISDAAKLVFFRAAVSLRDGDRAGAISDTLLLGDIVRSLQNERSVIAVLVGVNLERFQLRLVRWFIEQPTLAPSELRTVSSAILEYDARASYTRAMIAEGATTCAELRGPEDQIVADSYPAVLGQYLTTAIAGDALAARCLDVYRETSASMAGPVLDMPQPDERAKHRLNSGWLGSLLPSYSFPNLINGSERAWVTLELRRLARAAVLLREPVGRTHGALHWEAEHHRTFPRRRKDHDAVQTSGLRIPR